MNQLDHSRQQDGRRKYSHWLVTVSYADQETFGRVYTDREEAERYAARQQESPQVMSTQVRQIS